MGLVYYNFIKIVEQEIVATTMFFLTNFCLGKRKLKKIPFSKKLQKAERSGDQIRDCAFYDLVDEIKNNVCNSLTVSDCIRIMEAKLLGTKSEAYGPTHMRRKRKDCLKGYIIFCHKEGKSDVVMLNSSVSKLLHEFHLDKNDEKLVIRTATRLIWSDITSLNIDRVWYLDTSTYSDVKKKMG